MVNTHIARRAAVSNTNAHWIASGTIVNVTFVAIGIIIAFWCHNSKADAEEATEEIGREDQEEDVQCVPHIVYAGFSVIVTNVH